MNIGRRTLALLLFLGMLTQAKAQRIVLSGIVIDEATGQPVEFASVLLAESGLWAVTGDNGTFTIKNVPTGKVTLTVQCLGYRKRTWPMTVGRDVTNLQLKLRQESLRLDEVTVTARRKQDEATTSYTIDRTTLDNQQVLNLSDIAALLPGGKTVNPTLMSDNRLQLRSGAQEKGNAAFGTAVEVDGMRLDNNAAAGETTGVSTRTVSASNIESVEVVTGIPSVEYGDLSNGVVKVNTRRGKSPFIVEGKLNQHTRQVAVNKGLELGHNGGMLNVSAEHARSFSDAASPYTAYQRNILSLHYMNIFMSQTTPLTVNLGVTGNVGGYNSEADPDELLDDYQKMRDNAIRLNGELNWLLNRRWLTSVKLTASYALSDRKRETYASTSSASTQPYLHVTTEGYNMAQPYDPQPSTLNPQPSTLNSQPSTLNGIVLGPTGYWYVLGYHDSKPASWSVKLKAEDNARWSIYNVRCHNRLMAGAEYTGSHNGGRGTYYADMSVAPTWREYRYDELPTMHNVALYAEDKLIVPTTRRASAELTAGLRDDITIISGSAYGTVSSLSPRVNARYVFWRQQRRRWVSDLQMHAGWGKSVKLPSFQVLYPTPSYADRLAFASTSTADNTSYYAYHTYPSAARYNAALRWQYTQQTDLGVELTVKGIRVSLSAFRHRTCRPYMSADVFTPMTYRYTPPSALNGLSIPVDQRLFTIDHETGIVSVSTADGSQATQPLTYTERRTYAVGSYYTNASPLNRYGLEWMVDFAQVKVLRTALRLDGNYYYYKGTDDVLFADIPLGVNTTMTDGQLYQYVGYYRGSSTTTAGSSANASVSNGAVQRQLNLNATLTTHIPRIRLVTALRLEATLYSLRRALCELDDGPRGIVLDSNTDYFGQPYDGTTENQFVAVYPEYYATWDQPDVLLPFAERFAWARDNDQQLYNDLSRLVVRSNYAYTMNPNRLSAYYSANLSVTKEMGDHVSVSFYANNFFNTMRRVHASQTDLETSLFGSSYIPSFYYGLSLRLKI